MPILVICTNSECGQIMHAPDNAGAKKGRCPFCGTIQDISGPQSDRTKTQEPPPADTTYGEIVFIEQSDSDQGLEEPQPESVADGEAQQQDSPQPTPPPSEDKPPEQELTEVVPDLLDVREAAAAAAASPSDRQEHALETRAGVNTVFLFGLIGMAAGFSAGWIFFRQNGVLAAYVGSGLGWVAGFVLALIAVASVERTDDADAPKPPAPPDPIVGDCLQAMDYGTASTAGIFLLVIFSLGAQLSVAILWRLIAQFPSWPAEACWTVAAVCALIEFLFAAYALRVCLDIVKNCIAGSACAPSMPRGGFLLMLGTGVRGAGLLMLYVLPLVTIPLLPLGILALAHSDGAAAFDLRWARRAALQRPAQLVMLWLMLLMWGAVMAAVMAVVVLGGSALDRLVGPAQEGYQGETIFMALHAAWVTALSVIGAILGCAMFHCIGIFGKQNPQLLAILPKKASRLTIGFIMAAMVVSGTVVVLLLLPAIRELS